MSEDRAIARERAGRALAAVVEIAARALSTGDGTALWAGAVEVLARALDTSGCSLWELLPDGETLALRAAAGSDRALAGKLDATAPAGPREAAALRSGAPVAAAGGLSVPVPGPDRPFGVLSVERAEAFDAADLHFLQAVGHVLATATSPMQAEVEAKLSETRLEELERIEDMARAAGNGQGAARSVPALTPREQEVLALIAEGLTNAAIADRLGIGITTVRSHVRGVIEKLGVNSKLQAIVRAREQGLLH